MKTISIVLFTLLLFTSFQNDQNEIILGVWHYQEKTPKPGINTITEQSENGDIKITKLKKNKDEILHFFLSFEEHTLTQNKFGFKLKTQYKIKDHIIYLDDEPFFKIIALNSKKLVVMKIGFGVTTTYTKVEANSPLMKIAE